MKGTVRLLCLAGLAWASPAWADSADFAAPVAGELQPYLQCVPYARDRSGVQIFGDAHTWWSQAEGRYARGKAPRPGAVMAFRPTGNMRLGHVAAVSRVIDSRTVLLDHANWSPIDGRRGQIERGVKAIDVSPANDWSMVRVWYAPLQALGSTAWPVEGFIYNDRGDGQRAVAARAVYFAPMSPKPSRDFMRAFASLSEPTPARGTPAERPVAASQSAAGAQAARKTPQVGRVEPRRPAVRGRPQAQPAPEQSDPVEAALALYDR